MEGESRFPKFERWIEMEYPSVYEEEFYHHSDLPVGILFATFGWFPWLLSGFTLGSIQILGLAASLFGILLLLRAYVMYRSQLKLYRYHGLSRNTITDAIMFLDSKIVHPSELESPAPYTTLFYNLGMKDREYLRFIKFTAGLFVWPIAIVNEIKMDIDKMKRGTNRCSIVFVATTIILFFWVYSNLAVFILIGPIIVPIFFFLYTSYYYFQLAIKDMHLLNKEWIQDISVSESVQFEDVMNEILNRLHSEFPFPLRFHLARNYPLLVYTGRTKTTFALIRLKEAVLYPKLTEEKEESTGA